jgi:uncharacterized protein (TIGR00661 family)
LPLLKNFNKPVVLVAPLDWGLGHATRCIPIITNLTALGCDVIIAAEGRQKKLLATEFPDLRFIHLPGYHVSYGSNAWYTKLKLIMQVPKLLACIRKERKWLNKTIETENVDVVISDNRYGLHNKKLLCIFITHQLFIKTGLGSVTDRVIQQLNYRLIENFRLCWVPDYKGSRNLAGELSQPALLPHNEVKYIGPLSRFSQVKKKVDYKHLLIIISGPEPQRSIFESKLIKAFASYTKPVIMLRGLPGDTALPGNTNSFLQMHNHLPAELLEQMIMEASVVICRSGYSSVMDLIPMGKRCVFIPTPGQTEQRYLANYLSTKGYCLSYTQHQFSVEQMLSDLTQFQPTRAEIAEQCLQQLLKETLEKALAHH